MMAIQIDYDSPTNTAPTTTSVPLILRPLTSRQERRLVTYLDERFLQCTRNFKKRSEISSTLRTLPDYLEESRHLLALILQIPPVDPSTSLRIFYLLRLTGDVLSSIPGYSLIKPVSDPLEPTHPTGIAHSIDSQRIGGMLQVLLDFLDDLDHAWLAVLQGQVWDPETAEGVTPEASLEHITQSSNESEQSGAMHVDVEEWKTSPPSQTDVTRLRSLLLGGESALEDWLLNERVAPLDNDASVSGDGDLTAMLDRMGLLHEFDNLFAHTLDYLGGFGEDIVQVNTLGDEVPMSSCG